MNIAELVGFLGRIAEELNIPPPSQSKVESWITKGLIAGSKAIGKGRNTPPDWEIPLSSVSAARLILELEAKGAQRSNELRIGLWLAGHDIPLDAFREAVSRESERVVRRMLRLGVPQALQSNEFGEGKRAAALSRKLGPLDARFVAAGLELSEQLYSGLSKIAFLESRGDSDESSLISEALRGVAPIVSQLLLSFSIESVFAGLLGHPDEVDTSTTELMQRASSEQLEAARRFYGFFLLAIERGALRLPLGLHGKISDSAWLAVGEAMRHPAWMPITFSIVLRLVTQVNFSAAKADRDLPSPELARTFSDLERMVRSLQLLAR